MTGIGPNRLPASVHASTDGGVSSPALPTPPASPTAPASPIGGHEAGGRLPLVARGRQQLAAWRQTVQAWPAEHGLELPHWPHGPWRDAYGRATTWLQAGSSRVQLGKAVGANVAAVAAIGLIVGLASSAPAQPSFGAGLPATVALLTGAGGYPALGCQILLGAGASFSAIWCSSPATPRGSHRAGWFVASCWPAIALGLSLAVSAPPLAALGSSCGMGALVGSALVSLAAATWRQQGASIHSVVESTALGAATISLLFGLGLSFEPALALRTAIVAGTAWLASLTALHLSWTVGLGLYPTPFISQPGVLLRARSLADACFAPDLARPDRAGNVLPRTIFATPPALEAFVRELQDHVVPDRPFAGFAGLPMLHMYGPPGSGKSLSAQGICQAVGADLVRISVNELAQDELAGLPVAAINAMASLLEANLLGRQQQRPICVLLEEIDHLLPDPNATDAGAEQLRIAAFDLLRRRVLQPLQQQQSFIFVLTTTNHFDKYEGALRLLSQRPAVHVAKSEQLDQESIVASKLNQLGRRLNERLGLPPLDFAADADKWQGLLDAIANQGGTSGRLLDKLTLEGDYFAAGCPRTIAPAPNMAATLAGDIVEHITQLAALLPPTTEGHSLQAKIPNARARPKLSHAASRAEDARLLGELGLTEVWPSQLANDIARSLLSASFDPAKSFQLARLKVRFANVSVLSLLLLLFANSTPKRRRDFKDVPNASALDGHGALDGPDAWSELLAAAKASASMHTAALLRYVQALYHASGIDIELYTERLTRLLREAHASFGPETFRLPLPNHHTVGRST